MKEKSGGFNPSRKVHVTSAEAGMRLERWLKKKLPQGSYSHLQKLMRTGQIRLDGKRVKANALLQEGQEVRLPPGSEAGETRYKITPPVIDPQWIQALQQAILYEDSHMLVLNKPAGLCVQGGTKTRVSLDEIARALPFSYAQDLRLTHRLDKDTSGVLILAKTARDAAWITEYFKHNQIEKTYWALVVGRPEKDEGVIDFPLAKLPTPLGERIQIDSSSGGVKAVTRYEVKVSRHGVSWVAFYPQTGRTHQIRVHSAALGCPVLGDGKYGGKKAHPWTQRTRVQLHAWQVKMRAPGGEEKVFKAPLPSDMADTFKRLGIPLESET